MFFVGAGGGLVLWYIGLIVVKHLLRGVGVQNLSLSYPVVGFILLTGAATALFCGCSAM